MLRSGGAGGAEHGHGAWGARHYVAPQERVTERDASNVSLSGQHPFLRDRFVMKGVRPESPGNNLAAIGKQLFVRVR